MTTVHFNEYFRTASFLWTPKQRWKVEWSQSSLVGLEKHVCHFMNKQLSVCFFLQMVGFPPPHCFLFLFLLSCPSGPLSSTGYSGWFRLTTLSGTPNWTKVWHFRQFQSTKTFQCYSDPCEHTTPIRDSVSASVLMHNPKTSQTCYATTPTHPEFHTDDCIFKLTCWEVDGKLK